MRQQHIDKYEIDSRAGTLYIDNMKIRVMSKISRTKIHILENPFEAIVSSVKVPTMTPLAILEDLEGNPCLDTKIKNGLGEDRNYTLRQVLESTLVEKEDHLKPSKESIYLKTYGEHTLHVVKDEPANQFVMFVNREVNDILPTKIMISRETNQVTAVNCGTSMAVSIEQLLEDLSKEPDIDQELVFEGEDLKNLTLRKVLLKANEMDKVLRKPRQPVQQSSIFGKK